jgi:hypothetical protein
MNDKKTVRDALELAREIRTYNGQYVHEVFPEIDNAIATIDRMIETPAPQGWKLVPIEPTAHMLEQSNLCVGIRDKYRIMVDCAPTPAPTEKVDVNIVLDNVIKHLDNLYHNPLTIDQGVAVEGAVKYLARQYSFVKKED